MNNRSIPSTHAVRKIPSLSPYGWTDGRTDRGTNTLASHGLEEPAHALGGLEEHFFSSCAVVSVFWFWREIGCRVTYLRT